MNNSTILKTAFFSYNKKKKKVKQCWIIPPCGQQWRKKIYQYRLLKSGIDNKTLDSLKKGNNITLLTLEKLCMILDCTPNDVVRFVP